MKTLTTLIITLFFAICAIAQPWSGNVPGNIYYNQGNVGIGTTNPTGKFDVKDMYAQFIISNDGYATPMYKRVGGNTLIDMTYGGGDNGVIRTYYGGIQKVNIASNSDSYFNGGNVGIGTTAPGAKLDVTGPGDGWPITSGTVQTYGVSRLGQIGNNAVLDMGVNSSSGAWLQATNKVSLDLNYPLLLNPNGGNVGIGTTAPLAKVDVHSQSGTDEIVYRAGKAGVNTESTFWGFNVTGDNTAFIGSQYAGATNRFGIRVGGLTSASEKLSVLQTGNVGIGTTTPEAKLTVKGKIVASEIQVKDIGVIADYVFKPDYQLMSLDKVADFVKQNQHLPEVPSEKEFKKDGMNVAEMNALLLKKVEELTLYLIDQNKQINQLKEENKTIRKMIAK